MTLRRDLMFPGLGEIGHLRKIVDELNTIHRDLIAKVHQVGSDTFVDAALNISWQPVKSDLLHPLSEKWLSLQTRPPQTREQEDEFATFAALGDALAESIKSNESSRFIGAIENCYRRATGAENGGLRENQAFLSQGRDGGTVSFCKPENLGLRLNYLHEAIRTSTLPPIVVAMLALCVFLNIHPLRDGNGRTARALFNSVLRLDLRANQDKYVYLPIKKIIDSGPGGFEIRLRDAEINGNWKPLFSYLQTALVHLRDELFNGLSR